MKALVYHRYGSPDVLSYEDVDKPVPADNEVLIRVRAAAVNPYDYHRMRGKPFLVRLMFGLRKPKNPALGVDVSGTVEAIGKNVTAFKAGDEVFGSCSGSLAEYACAPEKSLVRKPANVTFEEAATVAVAGQTALQGLRKPHEVRAGQRVLINGAAGGVGTYAVQIAKALGAHVTAVCSTGNVEMVRSIGADAVIDYTKDDYTKSGPQYDVFLDCIGNHSLSECRSVLKPSGVYAMVGGSPRGFMGRLFGALLLSLFSSRKLTPVMAKGRKEDLATLSQWLEAGTIKPVIDRTYPLPEASRALQYLGERHARGKVVIAVQP